MATVEEIRRAQRAEGPAAVLAIGTATPVNCIDHSTFADYYFRITNSEDKIQLKQKFQRICNKSTIKKRYSHLTEEIVKENPNIATCMAPSLDARHDIVVVEVPKLGKQAAEKAIKEWGQPKSNITHLIFCTSSGVDMPGADYHLTNLLGLHPSVKRFMLYHHGCSGGGTAIRMAKDLAENNAGARVLVVCAEIMVTLFHGPIEDRIDNLVGQAIFGDGAAAVIVGSDPVVGVERPLFQIVSAAQTIIPDSGSAITGHTREAGIVFHLKKDIPEMVSKNIEKNLEEAFMALGISDWNSIFWVAHPGGAKILDQMEAVLGLKPEKLRVARQVLSEYGNVSSTTVLIVLDEMRKSSVKEGRSSTGEGLEWGVLISFGPGITVETVVLRSMPINSNAV